MHFMLVGTQAQCNQIPSKFSWCVPMSPQSQILGRYTYKLKIIIRNTILMSCQWKMACMAGRGLIFLIQL